MYLPNLNTLIDRMGEPSRVIYFDKRNYDGIEKIVHSRKKNSDIWGDEAFFFLNGNPLAVYEKLKSRDRYYSLPSALPVIKDTRKPEIDKIKIQVTMPTYNSSEYLLNTLRKIYESIAADSNEMESYANLSLLIGLNGHFENSFIEKVIKEVELLNRNNNAVSVSAFYSPLANKPNALNISHQLALENDRSIMVMIDDDISLQKGAIKALIDEIISNDHFSVVGGRPQYLPPPKKLSPVQRIIYSMNTMRIDIAPYKFPIGRLMGHWSIGYPTIPNEILGDDAYLNAFYYHHRKPHYIFEPSKVHYFSSSDIAQWIIRRHRIDAGNRQILELFPPSQREEIIRYMSPTLIRTPSRLEYERDDLERELKSVILSHLIDSATDHWRTDNSTKPGIVTGENNSLWAIVEEFMTSKKAFRQLIP